MAELYFEGRYERPFLESTFFVEFDLPTKTFSSNYGLLFTIEVTGLTSFNSGFDLCFLALLLGDRDYDNLNCSFDDSRLLSFLWEADIRDSSSELVFGYILM